ncbi:MAG: phosphate transport system substrate-binding protein [Micromonosporaceae bacterium]
MNRAPAGRRMLAALLAIVVSVGVSTALATPAFAAGHSRIEGSGSSWSANAVNQWIADVDSQGLQVVFTSSGSAQGRKDFALRTEDYGVSDIPYLGTDSRTGETDSPQGRPFAYLPIVAGGTSFPYQVKVGGQLVRNLRLSGQTIAKIFTNQIRNWNDAQITADNNGRKLPSLTIIPVVHSEGSGSTAQFTQYLDSQYSGIWRGYCKCSGRTEYFPQGRGMIAQNGSDGVMNFISSAAGNGAIGFDEYSYALNKGYPVVKVKNVAGYFTLPTQYNVAVALTLADIDLADVNDPTRYLTQKLDRVYTNPDNRTYPLSSYSYMILPTGTSKQDSRITTTKRQTLVDFLYYSICPGQREMGPLGYSPLPLILVQRGFDQVQKLKSADPGVDIQRRDVSTCNNPTFVAGHPEQNYLAQIAPVPPACDQAGQGPCSSGGSTGGGSSGGGSGSGSGSGSGAGTGSGAGGSGSAASASAGTHIDPETGQVVPNGGGSGTGGDAVAAPNDLAASRTSGLTGVLGPLAALELLAVLVVPVLLNRWLSRRRSEDEP